MAYTSWSVVYGEQPSAAKWNILGTNDASFNNGTGFSNGAIGSVNASLAAGIVCQVVNTVSTAVNTGTTTIPLDDTIPQITEGTEFMTLAITPKSATNILVIAVTLLLSSSNATQNLIGALFQDSTANALAVDATFQATAMGLTTVQLQHTMTAGTTSSTTFRVRAGTHQATTITINGQSGGRLFGATTKSSIVITEYKV